MRARSLHRNAGFTLVEVALVVLIGGIILAALSSALNIYIQKTRLETTQQKLDAIDEALQTYLNQNGAYPCPARRAVGMDEEDFGVALTACNAAPGADDDTVRAAGRGSRQIRIGTVPVRSLNLPDDYLADAWGGRFTYAVTEELTQGPTYDRDEGGIFVVDSNDNDVIVQPAPGSGHFVVVSHGGNASGATALGGGAAGACPAAATDLDGENCDNDANFRSTLLTSAGTEQFDDLIRARSVSPFGAAIPAGAVMAFEAPVCPQGWADYIPAQSRVIVGVGTGYALGSQGGSERHALAQTETGVRTSTRAIIPGALGAAGTSFLEPSAAAGHENRQPYVALRYCIKN